MRRLQFLLLSLCSIDSDTEEDSNSEEEDPSAPVMGRRSPGMQSSLVGEPGESCAGSSVLASWASGLTGDGPGVEGVVEGEEEEEDDISSVDSSCSDSHVPFLQESDFATAVQMAASAAATAAANATRRSHSGHTLPSLSGGGRRRRHPPRTPSPGYSTDSNYAALPPQPHRPYPKSERKRQMKNYGGGSSGRSTGGRYMYTGQPYHSGVSDDSKTFATSFTDSPVV